MTAKGASAFLYHGWKIFMLDGRAQYCLVPAYYTPF